MTTLAPLPDFRLERYFSRWEFAATHHLTASDAESMTVGELLDLVGPDARDHLTGSWLGYTPTWGTDLLREAVAATYAACAPEDVLTFAGAEEAIFWAMQLLAQPGDHVLVTVPNYQAMETLPLAAGLDVSGVPLDPDDGWALDLEAVRAAIRPTTRLLAVNFPNNPTGAVPDPETWRGLFDLCAEHGIRVVSDEVYRGVEIDPSTTLTQAADMAADAVSINVMSKAYGLPGLRVGWVACRDRAALELLERHKHYTSICNAGPSELLAAMALGVGPQILERNRGIVAANAALFEELFGDFPDLVEWAPPQGGCVAFPRYLGDDGAEELCRVLVEDHGVLFLPSSIYASDLAPVPIDRFRVGMGRRGLEVGLDIVREHWDVR